MDFCVTESQNAESIYKLIWHSSYSYSIWIKLEARQCLHRKLNDNINNSKHMINGVSVLSPTPPPPLC